MARHILAALLAMIPCGCSKKSEVRLTPNEFSKAFIETVKSADATLTAEHLGELEVRVTDGRDNERQLFLDNAYKEYLTSPDDVDELLRRFADSAMETLNAPESAAIDINRIVPVIKDTAYPNEVRQSLLDAGYKAEDIDSYYETLNKGLLIFYALDLEHNVRYLRRDEVESLELEPDSLRSLAVKNLKEVLPEIQKHGGPGMYMLVAGGTYEASLLLLDSIWSTENFVVQGEIVVAVPSRDLLLVTGSRDAEGLARLRKVANETVREGSYHLTEQLFVRRDGIWMLFEE